MRPRRGPTTWRLAPRLVLVFLDHVTAHGGTKHLGHDDRSVGLLTLLQNGNHRAPHSQARTVDRMNELGLALDDLLASVELDPNNVAALEVIGWIYLNRKDYRESIRYYSKVIEQDPNNAKAYHNRAGLYARLGDTKKAGVDVNIACEKGYADACKMKNRLGI